MKTITKTHVLYEDGVFKVDVYRVDGYLREINIILGDDEVTLLNKNTLIMLHDLLGTVLDREFD